MHEGVPLPRRTGDHATTSPRVGWDLSPTHHSGLDHIGDKLRQQQSVDTTHMDADVVLGGDSSEHQAADGPLLVYAITACPRPSLAAFNEKFDRLLEKFVLQPDVRSVEVHAKAIWNGDERRKTPFRVLGTKERVKLFFKHFT